MVCIIAARAHADLPHIADLANRLTETFRPSQPVNSVSSDALSDVMANMSECLTAITETLHALRVGTSQSAGFVRWLYSWEKLRYLLLSSVLQHPRQEVQVWL